mgnify:FL=1
MDKIEEEFNIQIPDQDLVRLTTVSSVAAYVEGRVAPAVPPARKTAPPAPKKAAKSAAKAPAKPASKKPAKPAAAKPAGKRKVS